MTKKQITCDKAPSAIGTYSQAITVGKFTFVSGQIPLNYTDMSIVSGSFEDQADVVMNNLKHIAQSAGCSLDNCVKFTVYLKNLENFSKVNTVMEAYLSEPYPARAAVEVSRLPKDVEIEVDAILYKD